MSEGSIRRIFAGDFSLAGIYSPGDGSTDSAFDCRERTERFKRTQAG